MNEVLDPVWSENVQRLRVGIQALDGLGRSGPIGGLGLHLEDVPRPFPIRRALRGLEADHIGLPGIAQSPTGRFAVELQRGQDPGRIVVRLVDSRRRYVPRRLSIPVPGFQQVVDGDAANDVDPTVAIVPRATRPMLFPGAAYGVGAGWTVVRGRVRWADGTDAQWTRVQATTAQPIEVHHDDGSVTQISPLLGRAHGDGRGEFLLVVGPAPRELVAPANPNEIELSVQVLARPRPAANAPVDSPARSRSDPLWHLPIEEIGALSDSDPVANGATTPSGFTASVTAPVMCRRGAATRPSVIFDLPV